MSLLALNARCELYDHVRQVQFHQAEPGRVTFRYVPKATLDDDVLIRIEMDLLTRLGEGFDLRTEAVGEIPLTGRGKHVYLVQECRRI